MPIADTLLILAASVVPAVLISLVLRWLCPGWSRNRISTISAAVVPVLIVSICAIMFVSAMTASDEACGVDACGMVMAAAIAISCVAVVGFITGWLAAFLVQLAMTSR